MVLNAGNCCQLGHGMFAIGDRETLNTIGFDGVVYWGGGELRSVFMSEALEQELAAEFVRNAFDQGAAIYPLKYIIAAGA